MNKEQPFIIRKLLHQLFKEGIRRHDALKIRDLQMAMEM